MNLPTLIISLMVVIFSIKEHLRRLFVGDIRVPKTSYRPLRRVYQQREQWAKSFGAAQNWTEMAHSLSQGAEHSFEFDRRCIDQSSSK
jgi:hypothetical protein